VKFAIAAVKKSSKHVQETICYTVSALLRLKAMCKWRRSCRPAYDIVKAIKELLAEQARIHVHSRATTGVTLVSLMKSIGAAPRPGSRGTTVFFVHPKTTEAAALGYPVEVVQEA
jgi:pyruvate/oxaloacetate carboxyltransferase